MAFLIGFLPFKTFSVVTRFTGSAQLRGVDPFSSYSIEFSQLFSLPTFLTSLHINAFLSSLLRR